MILYNTTHLLRHRPCHFLVFQRLKNCLYSRTHITPYGGYGRAALSEEITCYPRTRNHLGIWHFFFWHSLRSFKGVSKNETADGYRRTFALKDTNTFFFPSIYLRRRREPLNVSSSTNREQCENQPHIFVVVNVWCAVVFDINYYNCTYRLSWQRRNAYL